jgi:4-aminobutyrate aminotransferase
MAASGLHVENRSISPEPDVQFIHYPNPFRPSPEGIDADVQEAVSEVDSACADGAAACLIIEPILSDGGLIIPPDGYLTKVTETARRHNVMVICDEVKVGLGRTGALNAFDHDHIHPDIVCWGKALGNGIPLSAAVGPASVLGEPAASALLTTAGNPVSCAAGLAVLHTLGEEDLPGRAQQLGEKLVRLLQELQDGHGTRGGRAANHIGDVRGRGLAIGLELVQDRESSAPDPAVAAKVSLRCWQLGVAVFVVGPNVLEITPPLVISQSELETAVEILDDAICDVFENQVSDGEIAAFAGW